VITSGRTNPTLDSLTEITIPSTDYTVYAQLRREIVAGLEPGTPLRLRELADRFGISTMPVRAAVDRLSSEGLVVQAPRRGARVAPLDLADLEDIQTVRSGIEGVAVRLGVPRMSAEVLTDLRTQWDNVRQRWDAAESVDIDDYLAVIYSIHGACTSATEKPKLLALVARFRGLAERYLRASLTDQNELAADIPFEDRFLAACENKDPVGADEALQELLQLTVARLAPRLSTTTT
jgi:DNA-binding GntR family transcriptional regulator